MRIECFEQCLRIIQATLIGRKTSHFALEAFQLGIPVVVGRVERGQVPDIDLVNGRRGVLGYCRPGECREYQRTGRSELDGGAIKLLDRFHDYPSATRSTPQ